MSKQKWLQHLYAGLQELLISAAIVGCAFVVLLLITVKMSMIIYEA